MCLVALGISSIGWGIATLASLVYGSMLLDNLTGPDATYFAGVIIGIFGWGIYFGRIFWDEVCL